MNSAGGARILLLDIETAPARGFVWGKYEQTVIEFQEHVFLFSFAYKWLGENEVHIHALPDYKGYKPGVACDKKLAQAARDVLDQADILVWHNGQAFDALQINARLAYWGIKPPSPYKQVDTLLMARKFFKFSGGNKLDDLAAFLGVGRKLTHTGKDLWLGCYHGDKAAWEVMKRYNEHDVDPLLQGVYERLRPFANNHPRLDYFTREIGHECPTCQSTDIRRDGFSYMASGKRQLMECQKCGVHWKVGGIIKM